MVTEEKTVSKKQKTNNFNLSQSIRLHVPVFPCMISYRTARPLCSSDVVRSMISTGGTVFSVT